jgi:hypothetical protein
MPDYILVMHADGVGVHDEDVVGHVDLLAGGPKKTALV